MVSDQESASAYSPCRLSMRVKCKCVLLVCSVFCEISQNDVYRNPCAGAHVVTQPLKAEMLATRTGGKLDLALIQPSDTSSRCWSSSSQ